MRPPKSSDFRMACHIGRSPPGGGAVSGPGNAPGGTSRLKGAPDGASRLLSGSVVRRSPAP